MSIKKAINILPFFYYSRKNWGMFGAVMLFWKCLVLSAALAGSAAAAKDWVMLQGTEPENSPGLKTLLFLQPTFSYTAGSALSAGPFKGSKGIFNLQGPDFRSSAALYNARGFILARGPVPKTGGKINFLGMMDFGRNLLTGSEKTAEQPRSFQLADLSLTFNYLPFLRIRAGQFIAPGSNEVMKAVHVYDYIHYSNFTVFTMLDWNMPAAGRGRGANLPRFPNAGFRDIGLMAFDRFSVFRSKHTYALMLGRGSGISRIASWAEDNDTDIHGRYRGSFPLSEKSSLDLVLWGVRGQRKMRLNGQSQTFKRNRFGADLSAVWQSWRAELSGAYADGIIFHGTFGAGPPGMKSSKGQTASFLTLPSENAFGGRAAALYSINKYSIGLQYDMLSYGMRKNINERHLQTLAFSVQYRLGEGKFWKSPSRLIFNYELRAAEAPKLDGAHPVNQFLSDMDDRISISLFWFI